MAGSCAQRGPWSRLRVLLARVAIVSGIVAGAWLAGATVASAASTPKPDSDHRVDPSPPEITRVESNRAPAVSDSQKKSDNAPTAALDPSPAKAATPTKPKDAEQAANKSEKPKNVEPTVEESGKSNGAKQSDSANQKSDAPGSTKPKENGPARSEAPKPSSASQPATSVSPPPAAGALAPDWHLKAEQLRQDAPGMQPPITRDTDDRSPWRPRVPAPAPSPSTLTTAGASASSGSLRGALAIVPATPDPPGSVVAAHGHPELIWPSGTFAFGPPASPD